MQSAMTWLIVDDLMLCVATPGDPDRATLASFLGDLRSNPIRRCISTPLSSSDALSAEREECGRICAAKSIKVAVMVEPSEARAYAAVGYLTPPSITTFSRDDVDAALRSLDVTGAAMGRAREAMATLMAVFNPIAA